MMMNNRVKVIEWILIDFLKVIRISWWRSKI